MESNGTPKSFTQQPDPHVCPRCGGLLLMQHYMDLLDDTGQIDITAWHCAMCGEVIDSVILKNRRSPPPNLLYGTKARKFSQRVTAASDEGPAAGVPEEAEVNEQDDAPTGASDS